MENKMTDNDVIKALEYIADTEDYKLTNYPDVRAYNAVKVINLAIDLINRQKAEIERLEALVEQMGDYFPACINCEGKTDFGERTDKCVYHTDTENYCIARGIDNISQIMKNNRYLIAENKRLQTVNNLLVENNISAKYPNCVLCGKGVIFTKTLDDYDNLIGDISAEAIKEFAERLKEKGHGNISCCTNWVDCDDIDNLVKEMVGE